MARPVCIYARPNFVEGIADGQGGKEIQGAGRQPRALSRHRGHCVDGILLRADRIAIEDFGNEESYPTLGGYLVVIIAGFAGLLYALGVRKKKTEGEEA